MTNPLFRNYTTYAKATAPSYNIVQSDHWRITMITESLIRLEWSDCSIFEDHPTQSIVNRDFGQGKVDFHVSRHDGLTIIDTPYVRLSYDGQPFSKEGLNAVVKGVNAVNNTWHYGDTAEANLQGTARTLDAVDGEIALEDGILSTDGWAILDDSTSNIIRACDSVDNTENPFGTWVMPRDHEQTDLYVFAYGHRYRQAIQDFYRLTGPTPLLPRFVFGNWWSRYHRYTEEEYCQLIERFESEGIPFTTAVIDMDWHLVDDVDSVYGSGWTGYTWNPTFFPNPPRFLNWLHEHGLKITLNVHPRDGVRAFEKPYPTIAKAMGVDIEHEEPVEFNPTDPRFMQAYFDIHHELEDEGVDFWWLDWQQGGVTRQKGLDPLWILNHMHYLDSARDGRWPLTFSRYAGPGSHRYPIGFSGDTVVTWQSLQFQPQFTATASNIGYGWWSHDIGGHMFGYRDEELEARWYQLGTFSPINRLHSTDSPFNGKEPWNFHEPVRSTMTDALRLRQALIPYLYTMNWRTAIEGLPLVEPMYWQAADNHDAYLVPNEFRFGTQLLVAAITTPVDKASQRAATDIWLPQGTWFDFFTGRHYDAPSDTGRRLQVWRTLDTYPVFAPAGAIIPLQSQTHTNTVANPTELKVIVMPGDNGSFQLIEDNGSYADIVRDAVPDLSATARTEFDWQFNQHTPLFTVHAVDGDNSAVPDYRDWTICFRGVQSAPVIVTLDSTPQDYTVDYEPDTLTLRVNIPRCATGQDLAIQFPQGLSIADNPAANDAYDVLFDAQIHYKTKEYALQAIRSQGTQAVTALVALDHQQHDIHDFEASYMPHSVLLAVQEALLR